MYQQYELRQKENTYSSNIRSNYDSSQVDPFGITDCNRFTSPTHLNARNRNCYFNNNPDINIENEESSPKKQSHTKRNELSNAHMQKFINNSSPKINTQNLNSEDNSLYSINTKAHTKLKHLCKELDNQNNNNNSTTISIGSFIQGSNLNLENENLIDNYNERKICTNNNDFNQIMNELKEKENMILKLRKEKQDITNDLEVLKRDYNNLRVDFHNLSKEIEELKKQQVNHNTYPTNLTSTNKNITTALGSENSIHENDNIFRRLSIQLDKKTREISMVNKSLFEMNIDCNSERKILEINSSTKIQEINNPKENFLKKVDGSLVYLNNTEIQSQPSDSILFSARQNLNGKKCSTTFNTPKKHSILLKKARVGEDQNTYNTDAINNSLCDTSRCNNNNNTTPTKSQIKVTTYNSSFIQNLQSQELDKAIADVLSKDKEIYDLRLRLNELEDHTKLQDQMIIKLKSELNEALEINKRNKDKKNNNNNNNQLQQVQNINGTVIMVTNDQLNNMNGNCSGNTSSNSNQQQIKLLQVIDSYKLALLKLENQYNELQKQTEVSNAYCKKLENQIQELKNQKLEEKHRGSLDNNAKNNSNYTSNPEKNITPLNTMESQEEQIKENDELERKIAILNDQVFHLNAIIKEKDLQIKNMVSAPPSPLSSSQSPSLPCGMTVNNSNDNIQENVNLKELNEMLKSDNEALFNENHFLKNHNESLRLTLIDRDQTIQKIQEAMQNLQNIYNQSKKDYIDQHELVIQLNQHNQALNTEIEKLELVYKDKDNEYQEVLKSRDALTNLIKAREEELQTIKNEYNEMLIKNDVKIKELTKENEKSKNDTMKLKNSTTSFYHNNNTNKSGDISIDEDNAELIKRLKNLNEELTKFNAANEYSINKNDILGKLNNIILSGINSKLTSANPSPKNIMMV